MKSLLSPILIGLLMLWSLSGCDAPEFEISSLEVTPSEPIVGESVTVDAEVSNVGGADGIYTANLILDGAIIESVDIEVASKSSKKVSFKFPIADAGGHIIELGDVTTHIIALAPARFEVTSLRVQPAEVVPEETVTVKAEIQNKGGVKGEYKAALLVNDSIETTRDITLAAGASQWLTFNFSRSTPGYYQVSIGDMGIDFKVLKPADFKVYSLEINPNPVPVGDEVMAEVDLRNNGEAKGVYTLSITVNDDVIGVKEIELMGGEKNTVSFSFSLNEPGNYDVKVNDLTETLRVIDLVRPATGAYVMGKKGSSSYGHLDVDNGLDLDSLVVLTSRSEPEIPVIAVYVRAEDSCKIWPGRGPTGGRFYIYFACGMNWDNYAKEFTADKSFERFEEIFDFSTYYYAITLHAVAGGTADTEWLDEDEFPAIK